MIHTDFIVEVLGRFEGKEVLKGYVPRDRSGNVIGVSGVTIGTGFDLGQQTSADIARLRLPETLAKKLYPYAGLKKETAVQKLAELPVTLSAEEVSTLDKAVHDRYIAETAALFGAAKFDGAPKEAQAAAVSLHYQFGTPRRAASPALECAWEHMKAGDYASAAAFLSSPGGWSNDHRQFMPRRKAEAELLRGIR